MPLVLPLKSDWPVLWKFADRLRELDYTEGNVSRAMGVGDHCLREWAAWPAHVRSCRRQKAVHPSALLTAFFLVEELVEEGDLVALLGRDVVGVLLKLRWVVWHDGKLYFRFFLYPLLGTFILTDGQGSNPNHLDQVYHLGSDSHLLARLTPRPKVGLSLDHCSGSGVHAVLAAAHSERGFGLDINPRALRMGRINAAWNQRQNLRFVGSDCYQNVNSEELKIEGACQFDLITANPPFVPTPESLSLCRGGGVSGEGVTEKIVRGLPGALSSDGLFSMITNIPIFADQTFFERCQEWLDSSQVWGMAILSNHKWSLESYILAHQSPSDFEAYGRQFDRWLEAYESVKMEAITNSQIYLFRSDYPWRIHRRYGYPSVPVSGFIEEWIRALRGFDDEQPQRFRLHPSLEAVCWNDDRSQAYLKWDAQHQWWQAEGLMLEDSAARALRWCLREIEKPSDQADLSAGLVTLLGHNVLALVS